MERLLGGRDVPSWEEAKWNLEPRGRVSSWGLEESGGNPLRKGGAKKLRRGPEQGEETKWVGRHLGEAKGSLGGRVSAPVGARGQGHWGRRASKKKAWRRA